MSIQSPESLAHAAAVRDAAEPPSTRSIATREPEQRPRARGRHDGGGGGGGKKQGGVEKTKAAAATGLRKVKEGTTSGFQWIKDKCQKKGGGGKKQSTHEGSGIAGY